MKRISRLLVLLLASGGWACQPPPKSPAAPPPAAAARVSIAQLLDGCYVGAGLKRRYSIPADTLAGPPWLQLDTVPASVVDSDSLRFNGIILGWHPNPEIAFPTAWALRGDTLVVREQFAIPRITYYLLPDGDRLTGLAVRGSDVVTRMPDGTERGNGAEWNVRLRRTACPPGADSAEAA
jgi:hypothetical protein